ncbi:hypothetical protein [Polyangium sp. y55x31]|uniref:hypothetical protein n=1 Tax=Polyangium sp. y55x31 TaxID=3042688 RepID=UPI002482DB39|nr:hypothetical protein [Polyangium sp. y55x31]
MTQIVYIRGNHGGATRTPRRAALARAHPSASTSESAKTTISRLTQRVKRSTVPNV